MRSKKRNEEFPTSCPLSFIPSEATELLCPLPPALFLHSSVMAGDGVRRARFLLINTWLHGERMNRACACLYITLQMVGIMQPFVLGRRNGRRLELPLLAFSSSSLLLCFILNFPISYSLFFSFLFCHFLYIYVFQG